MKLIVGLGNPGKEYENTRHNIGFQVIDNYLENKNITWHQKFKSLYTDLNINNEKVYFLKPETYMNLSGIAIREFIKYYDIELKDILIIHDDLDLPLGKIRLKINSSSGGHNGIKSIIDNLQTSAFARLKIGIAKNKLSDTKDYVLGNFSTSEKKILADNMTLYKQVIDDFLCSDINRLMNKYNNKGV